MSAKLCQRCGAKCCKYFCFQIDTPEDYDQFEDVRWYLCHEGVSVHIDDGDWYMSVMNPCRKLDDSGRCAIYEDRPLICRKYDTAECDHTAGDYGYEELFETPEQLDAYARQTLGEKEYKRQKKRHRAKYEPKTKRKTKTKARPAKGKKGKNKKSKKSKKSKKGPQSNKPRA